MLLTIRNPQKALRIAVISSLSFMICSGLMLVLVQIKPFWVDEWRIIYNLKYKSPASLLGPLDFMQQFPRVYLELIKAFTSFFNYSYFTLRLPSYVVGTATIILGFRLAPKIYRKENLNRFLLVMILVSSYTFTEYFIQTKQYTMDMLLSLVAIWQLAELLKLKNNLSPDKKRYILLCASFIIVPFFSYTYPLAIAPVFIIVGVRVISFIKHRRGKETKKMVLLHMIPLLLCAVSISAFYIMDVAQLMKDQGMHNYWGHLMMKNGFSWTSFFANFYQLFAEVGSGLLFSIIFGVIGVASFAYGISKCIKSVSKKDQNVNELMLFYSVLLLLFVILLFAAGKLPVGEPRLNAFTIPAISILIINLLEGLQQKQSYAKAGKILSVILYAGVIGHIYTKSLSEISGPVYARKMNIYVSTENAIILAQAKKIPIFITPEVAYPYDKTQNLPFLNTVPGDWVLKTFPAYKVDEHVPVYALNSLSDLGQCLQLLPSDITSVLVGDGRSFEVIKR